MIDWSDNMDYYSGAPEPTDYDMNTNFNKGGNFLKKNSFLVLTVFAIAIAILIVVFFLFADSSKPSYEQYDDDSYLSELIVMGGELDTEFKRDNFEYKVYLNADSQYVKFECEASSKKSKVQGCEESIEVTKNMPVYSIRVEAEDGNVSKYYFTFIKK